MRRSRDYSSGGSGCWSPYEDIAVAINDAEPPIMDATALSVDTASPLLCARTVRPRSPAGLSAARAYRCMSSPAQISSVAALMVDRMLNRGACADEINGVALMALETPLPRGYVEARVAEREQQAAVKAALPPTAPVKATVPVPATKVSAFAPFNVLLKPMLALLEVIVLVPVKLTGSGNVSVLAPLTVIFAPT